MFNNIGKVMKYKEKTGDKSNDIDINERIKQ